MPAKPTPIAASASTALPASRTTKGQQRINEILLAAQELFVEGGYGEMTMRQVAERVGMSLSNLQHYFPSREDLLKALLDNVVLNYDRAYTHLPETGDPKVRLDAVLRYLVADVRQAATERLFTEIWSLAARDPVARKILDGMYTHHRRSLEALIGAAYPHLGPQLLACRAALVAMQIEGLMLLLSESKPKHRELKGIEAECLRAIHRILAGND